MKLEGSYEVKAPREKVWNAFLDPATLQKAIPGCEKLELIGSDEYKATLKIGIAAVKGTFEGKVRLLDKKPSESYRLAAEGSSWRTRRRTVRSTGASSRPPGSSPPRSGRSAIWRSCPSRPRTS